MDRAVAVHECLFCPQTFAAAAQKNEHVLQHFSHEMCPDCNETLIRIGGQLYIAHSVATCIKKDVKPEPSVVFLTAEPPVAFCAAEEATTETVIKSELLSESIADPLHNAQAEGNVSGQEELATKAEPTMDIDFSDLDEPYPNEPYPEEFKPDEPVIIESIPDEAVVKSEVNEASADLNASQQNVQPAKSLKIGRNKRYKCNSCDKMLSCLSSLRKHTAIQHRNPGDIICQRCVRKFNSEDELEAHERKCLNNLRNAIVNCSICNEEFGKRYLLAHMKRSHYEEACRIAEAKAKSSQIQYKVKVCEICGESVKRLRIHMISKHNSPDTPACTRCYKILPSFEELKEHRPKCQLKVAQTASIGLGKIFECYICRKRLKTLPCVYNHLKRHSPRPKIKCNMCDRDFFNQVGLKQHINQVHLNQRNFVCNICGQGLATKHCLRNHMYRHTGEKPYKCTFDGCGKSFRTDSAKFEHKRVHTGEKPFHCEVDGCLQKFTFPVDLKRHKFKAHGIYTKKHVCEICSEVFPERMILTKHMKRHHSK